MACSVKTKHGQTISATYVCDDGSSPQCRIQEEFHGSWVATYDDARRNGWQEGPHATMICPECAKQ